MPKTTGRIPYCVEYQWLTCRFARLATLGLLGSILYFGLAGRLPAQVRLTLQDAGSRTAPDWIPVYDGKEVMVSGQVSLRPTGVADSLYLPIQDLAGYGLLLDGTERLFRDFLPGDWVEAEGTVARQAGLPVLLARSIRRLSHAPPPAPKAVQPKDLASFRYLGMLVITEGIVRRETSETTGELISIGEPGKSIEILLPHIRRDGQPAVHAGDRIRVTGIAGQFCALPPYNRFFQVWAPGFASIAVVEKSWMIPPPLLLASLMIAAALLSIWWFRERRMARLRREMRVLNTLGEEVISASTPAEILRRLEVTLPKVSNSSAVGMYLFNRGTRLLESIPSAGAAVSIDPENPKNGMARAIVACYRNRTLLAIPDTRRSPFFRKEEGFDGPRAAIFVPMFAQSELVGVLELHHNERFRYYTDVEQAVFQHLANQIATALKLQEQHSVREQLFHSEKLAAAGRLISEVANELRMPLDSILARASSLRSRQTSDDREDLEQMAGEARRAAQIVARLDSLAKVEQTDVHPVDLTALLTGLLQFREPECKAKGVEIRAQLGAKNTMVMGSPGQLEQVLLNLLVDAEKAAADAREKVVSISTSLLARRVLIEILYATRNTDFARAADTPDSDSFGGGALALGACRGILQSHGGEFRSVRVTPVQARFDVELPVVETRPQPGASGVGTAGRNRQLTVLVADADAKVQRQLLQLLGERGDRVIPVASAEEGADLAQRVRFDMVICAVRQNGLNWVQFFERVRYQVGGFVLLTDGFDADLARAFKGGEGFVLSKPIDNTEVLRICRAVEERTGMVARG